MLPQVYTPDLPASPSDLAPFVSSLACFETAALGREDIERTQMYQAERSRREALEVSGGVENWLSSLKIQVRAAPLGRESLARAAQLLNKTNQFNLSLRRLDETSFWDWAVTTRKRRVCVPRVRPLRRFWSYGPSEHIPSRHGDPDRGFRYELPRDGQESRGGLARVHRGSGAGGRRRSCHSARCRRSAERAREGVFRGKVLERYWRDD